MLHTIIDINDIFYFSELSELPELSEKRTKNGIAASIRRGGELQPYSFFSTDPRDYLRLISTPKTR